MKTISRPFKFCPAHFNFSNLSEFIFWNILVFNLLLFITGCGAPRDPARRSGTTATNSGSPSSGQAGVTVGAISGPVSESGSTATFTVVLGTKPGAKVSFSLNSSLSSEGTVAPGSLEFTTTNWQSPQTVTVTGVDDFYDDGDKVFSIVTGATSSTDSSYNNLNPADVSVTNTDDETAGFSVSSVTSNSTEAGGTVTFTVALTSIPSENVNLPLSSSNGSEGNVSPASLTFTPSNWNNPQTVTVTGVDDNSLDGNQTYSVILGSATSSDSLYNGLNPTDVSVVNVDNDLPGFNVSPISGDIAENGATATFTIVLVSQPSANVTIPISSSDPTEGAVSTSSLVFTTGNWNTPQTVTVTGLGDLVDDGDQTFSILTGTVTSSDNNYNNLNPSNVSVVNLDNDTAGFTLGALSGNTSEAGGTATFTIVLTSQPLANVVVPLSSSNTGEGTVGPASLTFTSANWNTPQTVTVTGVNDSVDDGDVSYNIVTAAATSSDSTYNGLDASDATLSNTDNDTAAVTVGSISGTTSEASGAATFTIVLATQPTADVSLGLSSNNTAEGTVSPSSLIFSSSNWNTPQTVTVTGVNDSVDDGDVSYTIVTAAAISSDAVYNGRNPSDVSVTNVDNDTVGVTLGAISGNTTEGGGTATFTIILNTQPTADVTIGLTSNNTGEGTVSPSSVTFTSVNWNSAQTVTLTGVNDSVDDGDIAYTIVTAAATSSDSNYNSMAINDVSVSNTDNDTAGFILGTVSGSTTEAGGTATFTVALSSEPSASVSIGLTSDNTAEGTVAPASLTFTTGNWSTPQTVTVTGVNDFVTDGNQTFSIITGTATSSDSSYNGINPSNVSVINLDDENPAITISAISGATTEGGATATFTIVLNSQPAADVSLGITSNDTSEGTVLPTSVTFTPANWNTPQTVTVTGVNDVIDDGNIAFSIVIAAATSSDGNYNGLNPSDISVTNNDNDSSGFTLGGLSGNTTEAGGTATFTVVLTAEPSADVTTALSSNDTTEGTVSPASLTFTSGNWNTPQTVTVTGVDDLIDDGDISFNIVTAAATSGDGNYNGVNPADMTVTNTDNDSSGFTLGSISGNTTEAGGTATFTVVLASQPTNDVSLGLTSDDTTEGTVSPASLTFTSGNWSTPQTVTVTGVNDSMDDGDVTYNIVTAAATSSDGVYNGLNPSNVAVMNVDNDSAGITVGTVSGNTTEAGGTATFTLVLTSQPNANVSIGISSNDTTEGTVSPSTVTFTTGNWNTPQTVTVTGVDDFLDDGNIDFSAVTAAASSSDTNYNGLDPNNASVTNTDNDVSGVTVGTINGNTTETGSVATVTVVLTAQPTANVTIAVTSNDTTEGTVSPSSLVFTNVNWNAPQEVTVTGVDDVIVDGSVAYTIILATASSSDGNYNGINPSDVNVTNLDNDGSVGILVSAISGQTAENQTTATFTIVLNSQPNASVTIGLSSSNTAEGTVSPSSVTFSTVNWAAPQTVTVTGVDDGNLDGSQNFSIVTAAASSADGNYNALNPPDVSVTNLDDDSAGLTIGSLSGNTNESGTSVSFTVVLNSPPAANVGLNLVSSDTTEGTVSPSSLTFTSLNWSSPQTVTITGVNDALADGNQPYYIALGPSTSSDSNYNNIVVANKNLQNIDNDSYAITVGTVSGNTNEMGATVTFTISLTAAPSSNVTIGITSSDTTEGTVSPSSVTFTPADWASAQVVTITGINDALTDGGQLYDIITAAAVSSDSNYNGINPANISLTNIDDDSSGITVNPNAGIFTHENGTDKTFTVVLNSSPSSNVTIALSSSDTSEGTVSPSSLTFTSINWSSPQTVTVTGVDDAVVDGNQPFTIITGAASSADGNYNGLNPVNVSVTNQDDETPGVTILPLGIISVSEGGGTGTFTINLDAVPSANVTIALSSNDTTEGTVSPASVTFTVDNWNAPQTVTVLGVNDDLSDGSINFLIVTGPAVSSDSSYNGLNPRDVNVQNVDNDLAGITIAPDPSFDLTTSEGGGTDTFTIVLNKQPTASVTLGLSSNDTSEGTVSPASVTFTTSNWNIPQTVTVTGVDDALNDGNTGYIITTANCVSSDSSYNNLNPVNPNVKNLDDEIAGFVLSPNPHGNQNLIVTEAGGQATFTVRLNNAPSADVTIPLNAQDISEATISPASLVFTTANWNSPQTVTLTGADDGIQDGNQAGLVKLNKAISTDPNYNDLNPADYHFQNIDND